MCKQKITNHASLLAVVLTIVLTFGGLSSADEYYAGGVTVDIDYEILGYLWVEDATVNLYDGAHIVNDQFYGDVYATNGAVINIYGGAVDGIFLVAPGSMEFDDALVTIYGTDFAIDGVPVDPAVTEVYLENQVLSGVYESDTEFSHLVDCSSTGVTIKLAWLVEELTPEEQIDLILAYYEDSVDGGTVEPSWWGRKWRSHHRRRGYWGWWHRRDAFDRMLKIADRLIDAGYYDYALNVLVMTEKKCDGQRRPRDLVKGDGVEDLNEMINELIDTMTVE